MRNKIFFNRCKFVDWSVSASVRKEERIFKTKNLNQKTDFNKKVFSSFENERNMLNL